MPNELGGVQYKQTPLQRLAGVAGSMPALSANLQAPVPGDLVTLFQLDLTNLNGPVIFFTSSVGSDEVAPGTVTFDGDAYTPTPVEADGFETNQAGEMPRPRLRMGNIGPGLTSIMLSYRDLVGAIVRRIRTLSRHLDGEADADPTAIIDMQIYRINRKVAQNKVYVEWELASPLDHESALVPKGQALPHYCRARYRRWAPALVDFVYDTTELACPFVDETKAFDINDLPVANALDRASKTLGCCQKRFGTNAILPIMAFPGIGSVRT